MQKVTFIVTFFILIAWNMTASASQAFLSGTEIVIDLKKIEIPNLKELTSAALTQKNNNFFSCEFAEELALNGQNVRVYKLSVRPLWLRFKFPLPWMVAINEAGEIIEINGAALVNGENVRVDFILDN